MNDIIIPSEHVYFVRHKFQAEVTKQLRDQSLIAYNYLNEYHDDIQNYSEQSHGLTQTFNVFSSMMATGGIVVIDYEDSAFFTIAKIFQAQSLKKVVITHEGIESIFKAIETSDSRTYSYSNYPLMAAVRPIMSTACMPGKTFSQIARHLFLGESIEYGVQFMHPSSVELMVEAYLRSELVAEAIRIDYTLLRTGKTMPSVDIYGRSVSGEKIFVQVTNDTAPESKIKGFVDFVAGNGISILFSRDLEVQRAGLNQHYCLDNIFKLLWNHPSEKYQRFLKELSGIAS